ncbi:MAG: 50S ribosomal protein L11 methyltransferase [Thermoflexibacter sp.]|nr:50S ribosomal protein L11 methyltransferase [Thermoflexibacter sp.]
MRKFGTLVKEAGKNIPTKFVSLWSFVLSPLHYISINMFFITLKVRIETEFAPLLQLELADWGFDSFWEDEDGSFLTSIEESLFDAQNTEAVLIKYKNQSSLDYVFERVAKQNWNQVWEENYSPVIIGEDCIIRADFHQIDKPYQYDIVINPQMSFGTGHHETTALCVHHLIAMDLEKKYVADIGCGTGILSIMALKKGAQSVLACDIEDWAVENAKGNILANGFSFHHFSIFRGTAAQIKGDSFDVILANINLNILIAEIHIYASLLKNKGKLLLSGFYEHEIPQINAEASKYGFSLDKQLDKNRWTAILLSKL